MKRLKDFLIEYKDDLKAMITWTNVPPVMVEGLEDPASMTPPTLMIEWTEELDIIATRDKMARDIKRVEGTVAILVISEEKIEEYAADIISGLESKKDSTYVLIDVYSLEYGPFEGTSLSATIVKAKIVIDVII